MNKYEIVHDKKWLEANGYSVENNIIEKVDVNVIGHFDNYATLKIMCSNIVPYSCVNNTKNLGEMIRFLVEFLEVEKEDGIGISEIKDVPVRLVFDGDGRNGHWGEKAIGIGCFMKDKYVLFSDFGRVNGEMETEKERENGKE